MDVKIWKVIAEYFGIPIVMLVFVLWTGVKRHWVFGYLYADAIERAQVADTRAARLEKELDKERAVNCQNYEMLVDALRRALEVGRGAMRRLEGAE